ncbi:hypothetical protein [Paracoccus ravus]|uniref:hypothetical protein n=1 Tax=Paracoccus ravus TaxID=2447760 RepID=UPI00106E8B20|nr:hypothetical protein [Paracoccus ravus]
MSELIPPTPEQMARARRLRDEAEVIKLKAETRKLQAETLRLQMIYRARNLVIPCLTFLAGYAFAALTLGK